MEQDIRWVQRYNNFVKAMAKLSEAVDYANHHLANGNKESEQAVLLDEIIKEGLIQRFEYTHELAWNLMKDYAEYQGNADIRGSRDATREAFAMRLIGDGEVWMDMIKSRNQTSHTYNEETANEIFNNITTVFHTAFKEFAANMEKIKNSSSSNFFENE